VQARAVAAATFKQLVTPNRSTADAITVGAAALAMSRDAL
jgi:hypothetical protein